MPSALSHLCSLLHNCTEELEKETKNSINDCCNRITTKQMTDVQVALDKAKDYHYKEIINILSEIITNVKKMLFHEEKIRKLNDQENLTDTEIKRYSHVRRQISNFSGDCPTTEVVKRAPKPNDDTESTPARPLSRREIRRAASEVSVYSLEAWEQYQMQKEQEESTLTSAISMPNININPKLRLQVGKRKQTKFISSTFNNILDDVTKSKSLELLNENIEEEKESDGNSKINQHLTSRSLELLDDLTEDAEEYRKNKNTDSIYSDITEEGSEYEVASDVDNSIEGKETDGQRSNLNSTNNKYSVTELINSTSEAIVDTKPRIVDVVVRYC